MNTYSVSEEIAEKIITKVKTGKGVKKKKIREITSYKDIRQGELYVKSYIIHYNYKTDQYAWACSQYMTCEETDNVDQAAYAYIQEKRGGREDFTIMRIEEKS